MSIEKRNQDEFQKKFTNHKNSVVKIINNTFKRVKENQENDEQKTKVNELREEERTKSHIAKLQNQLKNEYKIATQFISIPHIEEYRTSIVTPLFTLPDQLSKNGKETVMTGRPQS